MKYKTFGIYFLAFEELIRILSGAFVDIGNLPATTSLHEDTDESVLAFSVSVHPSTATCAISGGVPDALNFGINDIGNGESQVVTIATPGFSNSAIPSYTLTIQCSSGGETDSADLTINIDANENFVLTNFAAGIATASVNAKKVKQNHAVFTVSYTDADNDPPLAYTITSSDPAGAPFAFNGDFVVATQDLWNHDVSFYTLYFDATDGRNTQSLELRITITDVNTPPEITSLDYTLILPELTAGRKLVYIIGSVDNDGDSIQFVIVSKQDPNEVFDIILSTGEVYIKAGFELDYETTNQYQFELTIKDEYHSATGANKILTIEITNEKEAPFWPSAPDPVSVDESSASVVVGIPSVLCDDPDGATDISGMKYRILFSTYSQYFTIDEATAQVSFSQDWDFDDKSLPETFSLTLQCVDPGSLLASTNYAITILDVNDNAPVCNPFNDTLSLTYAQPVSESITHLNCTDADSTINAELEYAVIGVSKGYGKTFFNVDTTGNVTIVKSFDMEYNTTFYVNVRVKDKGSPSLSTTVMLTVSYQEKPVINNYQEIKPCFFCTTATVTLVAAAGLVVALLCIFFGTLLVLWCCYLCEQNKMRALIASEFKSKTRFCDCCRPKHRRHVRRRKKGADISQVQQKNDKNLKNIEKINEGKITYTPESKFLYNDILPPGTVESAATGPKASVNNSQWNKFRKAL